MNSDDYMRYKKDSGLEGAFADLFKQQYPSVINCGDCDLHKMQLRAADMIARGLSTYTEQQVGAFILELSKTATDRG